MLTSPVQDLSIASVGVARRQACAEGAVWGGFFVAEPHSEPFSLQQKSRWICDKGKVSVRPFQQLDVDRCSRQPVNELHCQCESTDDCNGQWHVGDSIGCSDLHGQFPKIEAFPDTIQQSDGLAGQGIPTISEIPACCKLQWCMLASQGIPTVMSTGHYRVLRSEFCRTIVPTV